MSYSIGKYTSEKTANDVAHEPGSLPKRLLRAFVPHGDHEGHAWCHTGLDEPEEEPGRPQARRVLAERHQHDDACPHRTVRSRLVSEITQDNEDENNERTHMIVEVYRPMGR